VNEAGLTKRRLQDAAWLTQGPLPRLLEVLSGDGEEARVAGGAVRNAVMKLPPGDIDIATTATPEEVIRRVTQAGLKAVPTGIEHGTVTVVAAGIPFEVTTLRVDVETFGRKANVRFGRDWKADAERRDFTMNALTATADGTIHDYVGGLADLEARRVRFIGDPAMRIAEDYLRILRFFRFHAAYGEGEPDAAGVAGYIAGRRGLEQLSRERARMELLKLLVAKGVVPALIVMADAGLLGSILGGVPLTAGVARIAEIEAALDLAPDPIRRLAALNVLIVEDAERLWQRLRLANAEHEWLASMADGWWRVSPKAGEHAGGFIGLVPSIIAIACCWPGRAPRRNPMMTTGAALPRCRSAGLLRPFRSGQPILCSAAWRRVPRSVPLCAPRRRPGSRRIFPPTVKPSAKSQRMLWRAPLRRDAAAMAL
jgi:poly(A) polymerase